MAVMVRLGGVWTGRVRSYSVSYGGSGEAWCGMLRCDAVWFGKTTTNGEGSRRSLTTLTTN